MSMVFARILLRYASGALVAYGYLEKQVGGQIAADPDLVMALGALIGISVEGFYAVAKRKGWSL